MKFCIAKGFFACNLSEKQSFFFLFGGILLLFRNCLKEMIKGREFIVSLHKRRK